MRTRIPDAYLDLVNGPPVAALTTVMPDGQPHSSLVWCDYDGEYARVNTTRQREKSRNMPFTPNADLAQDLLPRNAKCESPVRVLFTFVMSS